MRRFVLHFVRDQDGTWICVRSGAFATVDGAIYVKPGDRFKRGQVTKGIDLAKAFDEQVDQNGSA
jgi:hypothetical protein